MYIFFEFLLNLTLRCYYIQPLFIWTKQCLNNYNFRISLEAKNHLDLDYQIYLFIICLDKSSSNVLFVLLTFYFLSEISPINFLEDQKERENSILLFTLIYKVIWD